MASLRHTTYALEVFHTNRGGVATAAHAESQNAEALHFILRSFKNLSQSRAKTLHGRTILFSTLQAIFLFILYAGARAGYFNCRCDNRDKCNF